MHIIWLVLTGTFFFSFFHILGILIPTDEVHHFSEGMKPPTSYSAGLAHIGIVAWMLLLSLYGNGQVKKYTQKSIPTFMLLRGQSILYTVGL